MSNIKYLLTILLLAVGVNMANAYIHFRGEQLTQIQEGDTIALFGVSLNYESGSQAYIAGTGATAQLEDSAVYVVENAGEVNGAQAWYFKNVATNNYIGYNYPIEKMESDQNTTNTLIKAEAAPFWFGKSDTLSAHSGTTPFFTRIGKNYFYPEFNEMTAVLPYAKDVSGLGDAKYWYLCNYFGGTPLISGYNDTNAFNVYRTTSRVDALATLEAVMMEYPEGVADLYTAGESIGCVPQQYVDALTKSYDTAIALLDQGTYKERLAAADAFKKALKDCKDNVIEMKEGYYSFEGLTDNAPRRGVMYHEDSVIKWENLPTDSVISEGKHIWKVTVRRTVDGQPQYDIQNYLSGYYMTNKVVSGNCTVDKDTTEYTINFVPAKNGYFYIGTNNPNLQGTYSKYYHCADHGAAGGNVVRWDATPASSWYIRPISQDVIDGLEEKVKQLRLNADLNDVFVEALSKYQLSRNYTLPEGLEEDMDYSDEGLVSEADQIWSNALLEGAGLGYEALVNGVAERPAEDKDWFHSIWSGNVKIKGYHNLQMHLSKPISSVTFKMSPRLCNTNNAVQKATVYACNDTTGGDKWVEVGKISSIFEEKADSVDVTPVIDLGGEYEFIRFDVTKTIGDALYNGVPNFAMGEFHAYEGVYDPQNSQFEVISNAQAFKAAIEKASVELTQNKATQATLEELKEQLTKFESELADPTIFDDKVKEALLYLDNTQIGDLPGFLSDETAITDLQAAIDAASATIQPQSSKVVIEEAVADVDAAIAVFKSKLNKLPLNTWFYIQSASSESPKEMALYVDIHKTNMNSSWSGRDTIAKDGSLAAEVLNRPEYMWQLVATNYADSVYIQNLGTGLYLTVDANMTAEPTCVGLNNTALSGVFNIIINKDNDGDFQYLNTKAKDGGYDGDVVTWNAANVEGKDNSSWKFIPTNYDYENASVIKDLEPQVIQPLLLPYDITGYDYAGVLYTILGKKDGKLILAEADPTIDEPIAAGTPMIYDLRGKAEDVNNDGFYTSCNVSAKPLTTPGIVGSYKSIIIPLVGAGYISDGKVKVSNENAGIRINTYSFYFDQNISEVNEEGDVQLEIDGTITDIKDAKIVQSNNIVNVYTLSGTLVRKNVKEIVATKGLPNGIYLVGNKKVIVE